MEGETLLWMQVADNNDWSLAEAQEKVQSSELLLWKAYFEWKVNAFHREDYFWAQIAQEIRRVLSKHPKRIKTEHFMLKFQTKGGRQTAESNESRLRKSKMGWLGFVGVELPEDEFG